MPIAPHHCCNSATRDLKHNTTDVGSRKKGAGRGGGCGVRFPKFYFDDLFDDRFTIISKFIFIMINN